MNERNEDFEIIEFKRGEDAKLRPGTKYLKDLQVGDIIRLRPKERATVYIPADVVLLGVDCACHEHDTCGKCYISTQHIDGNSSSHVRQSPDLLIDMEKPQQVGKHKGTVSMKDPTQDLFDFEGVLELNAQPKQLRVPLNSSNFVPRGCTLFDARAVNCLVVYVGKETKISQMIQCKESFIWHTLSDIDIDQCVFKMIVFILALTGLIFLAIFFETKISDLSLFEEAVLTNHGYTESITIIELLSIIFLDLQFAIPISILFIIEITRIALAKASGESQLVNPKNIDDLGKISHIIMDGQDILTTNEMEVKALSADKFPSKCDYEELMDKFKKQDEESLAIMKLVESIFLIQHSESKQSHDTNEDIALNAFIKNLGYNKSPNRDLDFNSLTLRIEQFFSIATSCGAMFGVVTKKVENDKREGWQFVIEGNKKQFEDIRLDVPPQADFSLRGLNTIYYASGQFDEEEAFKLNQLLNQIPRMTLQEKNERLLKARPKDLRIVGSVGLRNKVNMESKNKIMMLKEAGVKPVILSKKSFHLCKAYCNQFGIKGENIETIENKQHLENAKKRGIDKEYILMSGTFLNEQRGFSEMVSLMCKYDRVILSDMSSQLKVKFVKALSLHQTAKKHWWRFLMPCKPYKVDGVLVVGVSAHDVPMIKAAGKYYFYFIKQTFLSRSQTPSRVTSSGYRKECLFQNVKKTFIYF